ncbi:MAG TPA: hypothetical protein VEH76_03935 [Methylocystis sp.]|nr:hypothetical protein [Methylocystis sp.]
MGDEIGRQDFCSADFDEFSRRLALETEIAREMFAKQAFAEDDYRLGFELEAWILDHNYFPSPVNQPLLKALDNPLAVAELSRFNVEFNCEPLGLEAGALDRAEAVLSKMWAECNAVAHGLDANIVMIGTLPTIRDEDLTLENITPLNRYYSLNEELQRRRRGAPVRIDISGEDRLVCERFDLMLEAATTSFQIHLQTPADAALRYYNASVAMAAPLLSACGNAPFLFGKGLWEETRIPLFEQAINFEGSGRVGLGRGYLEESCLEHFEQNLRDHPVLLPVAYEDPPERLRHLRLHNGTIWRWNRLLIGFNDGGAPHLRIEHRILPAGPTIVDMIANAALYLGLIGHLANAGGDGSGGLPFAQAAENFYAAARHGLGAELSWPGEGRVKADALLLNRLLPAAREGLAAFGLETTDDWRLDLIEARVRTKRTGAAWQREALAAAKGDVHRLMAAYCERQRCGEPAHQWEL